MSRRLIVVTACAALALAACSSHTSSAHTTKTVPTPSASPAPSISVAPANAVDSALPKVVGAPHSAPTVTVPKGSPPKSVVTKDLIVGTGATATATSTVTIKYVGASWTSRKTFDSSWKRGAPLTVGLKSVIPAWRYGIPGMKVGGRRLIVVPASAGYGAYPPPKSGIAKNDSLVFVVDLVKVVS